MPGSSARANDTIEALAAAWQNADVQVPQPGKVKIVEDNRFTFYYNWDKDGYRYEFVSNNTDFDEYIKILNSITEIN